MAIKNIITRKLNIFLNQPFFYFSAKLDYLPYVLVKVKEDGIFGVGEIATAWDITGETQESAQAIINLMRPFIVGREIREKEDIVAIMEAIEAHIYANQAAKSGIEMALFDLLGKKQNMPVYRILGGKPLKFITAQKTFSYFNENNLEAQVKKSLEEAKKLSAKIVKYKVGLSEDYDLELVKAVRKYDNDVKIVLDVNQGWRDFKKASKFFARLKNFNICWIEQPVKADDLESMAKLRKLFDIPIMADESVKDFFDCELIQMKKAADIINIKLAKAGGFIGAKKIIDFCEQKNMKYFLGDMIHSSVGTAANLHLATLGNFVSCDIGNSRVKEDVAKGVELKGLKAEIPQKPGLGVELIEKYAN